MVKRIIPLFIPHRGCTQHCVFCNQRSITGITDQLSIEALKTLIDQQLSLANGKAELAFYGGTFTGLPMNDMMALLDLGLYYYQNNKIKGIRVSTHPATVTEERVAALKQYPISLVELGVQSFSNDVLSASKRGCTTEHIEDAIRRLLKSQIAFGIQLMMGLPSDTKSLFLDSVKKTIAYKPEVIRIYPTVVIAQTTLAEHYLAGQYVPLSLEEAVDWGVEALKLTHAASIPVIRMGLHATEDLMTGSDVLAGPLHPSFRQLVESEAIYRALEKEKSNENLESIVSLVVHPSMVSAVAGQKGQNRKKLNALFEQTFAIKGQAEVSADQICIEAETSRRFINIWS